MPNISDFKSQLLQGGFRPNQFKVTVTFPAAVAGGVAAGQKLQFLAKSASLPESTIQPVEVMYRGRPVKFAGERTFAPWSIDVYADTDFSLRNSFEAWVDMMAKADSSTGALLPSTYQTDVLVEAMDRNDRVVKTYKLVDAFPAQVGQIQLDWDANNQIALFPVTLEYNYFLSIGAEGAVLA